jgi:hypothetical protein
LGGFSPDGDMTDFTLKFDTTSFRQLDEFALLACQEYNLGNRGDWFGNFRGGLHGFYARLHGVAVHYRIVHAWLPNLRSPTETEYHLASIFFNMDSATECLTFALNALGYAAIQGSFRDVSNAQALRYLSPKDILGNPVANPPTEPLAGYAVVFPNMQSLWQNKRTFLDLIVGQHDVSKHRETIFTGGRARQDPPMGFYESLDIPDDAVIRSQFWPMAEIILKNDPKLPKIARTPQPLQEHTHLETVAAEFVDFIRDTGSEAFSDARSTITIPEKSFRQTS